MMPLSFRKLRLFSTIDNGSNAFTHIHEAHHALLAYMETSYLLGFSNLAKALHLHLIYPCKIVVPLLFMISMGEIKCSFLYGQIPELKLSGRDNNRSGTGLLCPNPIYWAALGFYVHSGMMYPLTPHRNAPGEREAPGAEEVLKGFVATVHYQKCHLV